MNEASQRYWDEYWASQGQSKPKSRVTAWQFGGNPDYLAQLVIDGIKTATCSARVFYEIEQEPLPASGDYSVILNSNDVPVAMIKTVDVQIMPMNEVPEEFAIAEGEGDKTYRYWKEVHEEFFTEGLQKLGLSFSEDIQLVCERFVLVDKRQR